MKKEKKKKVEKRRTSVLSEIQNFDPKNEDY
jgi:hypothetical protein